MTQIGKKASLMNPKTPAIRGNILAPTDQVTI
jgi:hypothetical protein